MIDLNDAPPQAAFRYDLDELSRRLGEQAESWVPQLFPNGRQEAGELRLANIRGDAPRKTGSCVIPLAGDYAGCFHDFDTGESGGPLKTLEHATGLSGRALFDYAAGLVGLAANSAKPKPARRVNRAEDIEREIAFLLSQCQPLSGTPAAAYLASRGLPVPACPDLQFHPSATYHDTATGYPALIAVVRESLAQRLGIHRTYLSADGSAKAAVPKPRMMLGPVAGGTVQLVPLDASPVLGIAEGIETALSALFACPALPVWAALSAGNLEKLDPPAQVTRVVLLADHDASGTGLKAAERAAARHYAAGRRIWIALPPRKGDDFNDLLRREGIDAVRAAIDVAREWQPEANIATTCAETVAPRTEGKTGGHKPLGFKPAAGKLPVLRADNGDLAEVTDRCW
ncbi:MAG: ATPase, partial [Azospirillum sp.]|nr:ATPase [Azospirillum sp.]